MSTKTEDNVFNLVKEIGYIGSLLDKNEFSKAVQEGIKSIQFSSLVSYLCNELRIFANLDECVSPMTTTEDSIAFVLEVSSLLKESGCPYSSIIHGHASDRFSTVEDKLLLLEYLITEIMAARILKENKPEKKLELKLNETPQAADLRKILQTLGFSKPPSNITVQMLIQKLIQSIQNTITRADPDLISNSMFNGMLSEKQWEKLNDVQKELHEDYSIRRDTLIKRLDCTIQSFQWSDKTKGKEDIFEDIYSKKRKLLKTEPDVDLSDLLAAREDLAIIEKTDNANVRKNTQSAISKVLIGKVPDRGGRTSEQAPPPPEMPSWQQRSAGPSSGGRGRGGFQQSNRSTRGGSFNNSGNFRQNTDNLNKSRDGYNNAGGNDYSRPKYYHGSNVAFDSAGSYGMENNYSQNSRDSHYQNTNYYSGGSSNQNSSGNYSNYNEPKRQKTFEEFQQSKTSYADQYVQENRQNRQYRPRSDNAGPRGKSNYQRGGYR